MRRRARSLFILTLRRSFNSLLLFPQSLLDRTCHLGHLTFLGAHSAVTFLLHSHRGYNLRPIRLFERDNTVGPILPYTLQLAIPVLFRGSIHSRRFSLDFITVERVIVRVTILTVFFAMTSLKGRYLFQKDRFPNDRLPWVRDPPLNIRDLVQHVIRAISKFPFFTEEHRAVRVLQLAIVYRLFLLITEPSRIG